jgi:hypothetical protein
MIPELLKHLSGAAWVYVGVTTTEGVQRPTPRDSIASGRREGAR